MCICIIVFIYVDIMYICVYIDIITQWCYTIIHMYKISQWCYFCVFFTFRCEAIRGAQWKYYPLRVSWSAKMMFSKRFALHRFRASEFRDYGLCLFLCSGSCVFFCVGALFFLKFTGFEFGAVWISVM